MNLDDAVAWAALRHAYGEAGDIPALLRAAELLPPSGPRDEPSYSLWSSLCHQGDVYEASFAALPHLVRILEAATPCAASFDLLHLAARIEAGQGGVARIPEALAGAYREALDRLPRIAFAHLVAAPNEEDAVVALYAISVCAGRFPLAEAVSELNADVIEGLLDGSVADIVYQRHHEMPDDPASSVTYLEENWMRIVQRKPDGTRSVEYQRADRRV